MRHGLKKFFALPADWRCRRFSVRWCGVGAAILGLLMTGFGLYRGEMAVVFTKAVNICLECIGIG